MKYNKLILSPSSCRLPECLWVNENKHVDIENRGVVTRGKGSWGREKWVKGGQLYGDHVETKLLVMSTLQCIQELK